MAALTLATCNSRPHPTPAGPPACSLQVMMEAKQQQGMTILGFAALVAAYLSLNSSLNLLVGLEFCRSAACHCTHLCLHDLFSQNKWALGVYGFRFPFMLTSAHSVWQHRCTPRSPLVAGDAH